MSHPHAHKIYKYQVYNYDNYTVASINGDNSGNATNSEGDGYTNTNNNEGTNNTFETNGYDQEMGDESNKTTSASASAYAEVESDKVDTIEEMEAKRNVYGYYKDTDAADQDTNNNYPSSSLSALTAARPLFNFMNNNNNTPFIIATSSNSSIATGIHKSMLLHTLRIRALVSALKKYPITSYSRTLTITRGL